jgi:hypothetical protein
MTKNSKITLTKRLDVTDLAGEKVMIDFESGKYFLLKGSANDIWEYLQHPITIGEILNRLQSEYEVDVNDCLESIIAFLSQIKEYGFIQIEE